jgi:hypothetical protein
MYRTEFFERINGEFTAINDHRLAELAREDRLDEVYFELSKGKYANLALTEKAFLEEITRPIKEQEIRKDVDDELRYT